jgi:hypothetical protein
MKILVIALTLLSGTLAAQSYNVLLIPDSLKKNADMVVRADETILEIKSPGRAVQRTKHAYTILNETGAKYAGYVGEYDKFTDLNSVDARLYDAMGKELKHVKKKDMQDMSGNDDESLMVDSRYKVHNFYYRSYPYTVEFEEESDLDGLFFLPSWTPLDAPSIACVTSKYVVIAPKDYVVRYRPSNCKVEPVITEERDKKIYTWQIDNLPAIVTERYGPVFSEITPRVYFAPSQFEVEGYKGDMSTWEGFGKFIFELTKGRDQLPDDVKARVHALTDGVSDPRKKAELLYEYMQKNTRYISVQLGIGGWQPFDAKYVATKKYGDCKALSNYMVALLKEAGVPARYVVITGGTHARPLLADFPSMQGNHVVACVPLGKDTMWLECTSQTVPAGYQGEFTGDRKAILIDENGGHIVNTTRYTVDDNLQYRTVNAAIDAEGNLDAQVNTRFSGTQMETPHQLMFEVSKDWREKYLNEALNLPTYQVEKSNYEEVKGSTPLVKEDLHVLSAGYASVTGKRFFVTPNLFNRTGTRFSPDSVRKYDIVFPDSFRDIDSIVIKIPAGYSPESMPANTTLDSRFGKYKTSCKVEGDKISYYRFMERTAGHFPPADYQELVKFQEQIYKNDRTRIVFVKKD